MQVAQFLSLKLTQQTASAQQWRKQALESGVLHASLCGIQSEDQTIAEPCAGIVVSCRYSLINESETGSNVIFTSISCKSRQHTSATNGVHITYLCPSAEA